MTGDMEFAAWVRVKNAVAVKQRERLSARVRNGCGYERAVRVHELNVERRAFPRSRHAQSCDCQKLQQGCDRHSELPPGSYSKE